MRLLPLLLTLPLLALADADANAQATASGDPPGLAPIIARANVLLSAGQFSDAVRSYSDAIDLSPKSYVLFFKRATAYLSLNRHAPALEDFETVLSLTSGGFDKAYLMKAKIYTKEARWGEARDMLKLYSSKVKNDKQAGELQSNISEGEVAMKKATSAQKSKSWETCVEEATKALHTATYSAPLRRMRADCALAMGDIEQAVGDFTRLTHLISPSTALMQSISTLSYYLLPPSTQSLQTIKQCLHYDPDSKPCKAFHKQIRNNDKQLKQLDAALEASDWRQVLQLVVTPTKGLAERFDKDMAAALEELSKLQLDQPLVLPASIKPKTKSPMRAKLIQAACKAYVKGGQISKAEKWCDELLKMEGHEKDEDALVAKGEMALKKEEWEEAVRLFNDAFEAGGRSSQDIMGKLQKAQRLLKQSKAKDYYKVLGVPRDADIKTIKRAYRKHAKDAHPDRGGSEEKMAIVNEAYEVLNDPELRARFDNGDDPNDPQSGPNGGNPFQGHPFGGFHGFQGGGGFPGGGNPFGGSQQFQFQWGG